VNRALLMGAVLALALLAAFYYFVDIRGHDAAEEQETEDRRLVAPFDQQSVRTVIIEPDSGPVLRVSRSGAEAVWRVETPLEAEADPDVLLQLLETMNRLTAMEAPFLPGEDGMRPYGLEPPRVTVTLEGEGNDRLARLKLGGPAPFGAANYAAVQDSGEVGLVTDSETGAIPGTLFDLREKRLVRFHREEVREIRLESPGLPELFIRRLGDDWEIVHPLDFAADRELVGSLLWELTECRALEFPGKEGRTGLDENPSGCRITLGLADGSEIEARFGDTAGAEDQVFAAGGTGTVMTVNAAIMNSVRRPAEQWRELRPFPRYAWEVDGLTVARAGSGPVGWSKGEDGSWKRDGETPGGETAQEAIDRALELLTGLKACAVAGGRSGDRGAAALDPPAFTVTLISGSAEALTEESLDLGFPENEVAVVPEACGGAESVLCGSRPGSETIYVMNKPGRDELRAVLETLSAEGP
jgi:hypothetical protein